MPLFCNCSDKTILQSPDVLFQTNQFMALTSAQFGK